MNNFKTFFKHCCLFVLLPIFANNLYSQDTLTLNNAIKTSLENNLSIKIAGNELRIAKNNNSLGNSGFLPVVDFSLQQNNNINSSRQIYYTGELREATGAESNSFTTGIMLNWTVFDGMNMFISHQNLKLYENVSDINLKIKIEEVISDVISVYSQLVLYQNVLKFYEESVKLSKERLNIAEKRKELGSASNIEYLQASLDLNNDSTKLIKHLTLLTNAKYQLNTLLSQNHELNFNVENDIIIDKSLNLSDILDNTLKDNTTLQLLRTKYLLASNEVKSARSKLFPQLDVFGGYNFSNSLSQTGMIKENRSYGPVYGLSAHIKIFDGRNEARKINNAKIMLESQTLFETQTELEIKNNLSQIINKYYESLQLIKMEEKNLIIANENYKASLEKYKLGSLSGIELRESQNNLLNAEINLHSAYFNAKTAETNLKFLSGRLIHLQ